MMLVKCKACTKRYDYHEHGCCPECGAYNRPPRRNQVGVDGVVHRMSDADFLENTAKRRGSQSGKVCFEQDVCFEDQARQVRDTVRKWAASAQASRFTRDTGHRDEKKKSGPARIVAIVVTVILVTNILPLLLTMCSVSGTFEEIIGEVFDTEIGVAIPEERPTPTVPAVPDGADAQVVSIAMGQKFLWWDEEACVTEVTMDEAEDGTKIDLTLWMKDPYDKPTVCYRLPDGTWAEAECEYVSRISDNDYTYYFYLPDRQPGSECYAVFAGYNSDVWCEFHLSLAE